MANYKILEEKKKELTRKHLKALIPFIVLSGGFGFYLAFRQMSFGEMLPVALVTLVLFAGALALGLFWGMRIYKDNHLDIYFVTEEASLSIFKKEKLILKIPREDIRKIEQYPNSGITVFWGVGKRVILNDSIEEYEALIAELAEMHPIQQADKKTRIWLKYGLILLALAPYLAFHMSNNNTVVLISGVLFFLFMLYGLISFLTRKGLDKRVRIASLAILFLLYNIGKELYYLLKTFFV